MVVKNNSSVSQILPVSHRVMLLIKVHSRSDSELSQKAVGEWRQWLKNKYIFKIKNK